MAVVFNRLEGMSPSVYRRKHRRESTAGAGSFTV
jgi:hypothetical protein